MRKIKILLVLFIVILCFFLADNTNAYECTYIQIEGGEVGGKHGYITVNVDPVYGVTSDQVLYYGDGEEDMDEPIENWNNIIKDDGYSNNFTAWGYTYAQMCPPYIIAAYCADDDVYLYASSEKHISYIKENSCRDSTPMSEGWPKVLKVKGQPPSRWTGTSIENLKLKPTSCLDFNKEPNSSAKEGEAAYYSCEQNPYFACVWNELDAKEGKSYCNTDKLQFVTCGDAVDIPPEVPSIISFTVNLLKIVTPLILIFISIISLIKAISSQKEDEIKKAQSSLISKIIISVIIFFVISIVQFVILRVADAAEQKNLSTCLSCFLNNDCAANKYYKTYVSDEMRCHLLNGKEINCETGK